MQHIIVKCRKRTLNTRRFKEQKHCSVMYPVNSSVQLEIIFAFLT